MRLVLLLLVLRMRGVLCMGSVLPMLLMLRVLLLVVLLRLMLLVLLVLRMRLVVLLRMLLMLLGSRISSRWSVASELISTRHIGLIRMRGAKSEGEVSVSQPLRSV
jgi:hypothetical protein